MDLADVVKILLVAAIGTVVVVAFAAAVWWTILKLRAIFSAIKSVDMKIKKLIILWAGIFIIVAMCLFPPFVTKDGTVGYAQLFSRQISIAYSSYDTKEVDAHIDIARLIIQCAIVGLITGALLYTLKDKKAEGGGK